MVDISVQYPRANAGRLIVVEPLDGGRLIANSARLLIAPDGTLAFRFQAGQEPGVYQISLHDGAEELGVEFWVLDPDHPDHNPPGLIGRY